MSTKVALLPAIALSAADYEVVTLLGTIRVEDALAAAGRRPAGDWNSGLEHRVPYMERRYSDELDDAIDDVACEMAVAKYLGCRWSRETKGEELRVGDDAQSNVVVRRVVPGDSWPEVRPGDLGRGRILVAASALNVRPDVVVIWGARRFDDLVAVEGIEPSAVEKSFRVPLEALEHIDSLLGEPVEAVLACESGQHRRPNWRNRLPGDVT